MLAWYMTRLLLIVRSSVVGFVDSDYASNLDQRKHLIINS